MFFKHEIGKKGEKIARDYLRKKGYRILEERYRTRFGELDLVCREGKEIIFVEVRTRKEQSDFKPEESIGAKKMEHLIKSAKSWLIRRKLKGFRVRFDLITVNLSTQPPMVFHYPALFDSQLDL